MAIVLGRVPEFCLAVGAAVDWLLPVEASGSALSELTVAPASSAANAWCAGLPLIVCLPADISG